MDDNTRQRVWAILLGAIWFFPLLACSMLLVAFFSIFFSIGESEARTGITGLMALLLTGYVIQSRWPKG